jgi:hypothetical protein
VLLAHLDIVEMAPLVLILMNVKPQLNHVLLQLLAPIMSEITLASVILDIQEMEKHVQTLMSA